MSWRSVGKCFNTQLSSIHILPVFEAHGSVLLKCELRMLQIILRRCESVEQKLNHALSKQVFLNSMGCSRAGTATFLLYRFWFGFRFSRKILTGSNIKKKKLMILVPENNGQIGKHAYISSIHNIKYNIIMTNFTNFSMTENSAFINVFIQIHVFTHKTTTKYFKKPNLVLSCMQCS